MILEIYFLSKGLLDTFADTWISLLHGEAILTFLSKASFGLRELSLLGSVCLCVSVRPCVNHELVRAMTLHPFKLGSPTLDYRCKRPWLRSLLFGGGGGGGGLTLTFKVKFNIKVISHHLFRLMSQKLGQRCKIPWLRSLLFWGLIGLDMSNETLFKNPVNLHRFYVFEIFVGHAKAEFDAHFYIPHGTAHMLIP